MQQDTSSSPQSTPSRFPNIIGGSSWQEKFSIIVFGIVIVALAAVLLISRGVLKNPFPRTANHQLTDEQKIQILKNLSGSSSGLQPSDQQKLQILQKLSQPSKNISQPSDADKLKTLQQLNGK